jgi:hypothetical protein
VSERVAITPVAALEPADAPDLRRSWGERRALRSTILTAGAWVVAVIASVPLFSALYMLIVQGGSRLSLDLFTELPPAGFEAGGGFGNAIVGTLVMVAIAAVISIPTGILAATYLAELNPDSRLAGTARFLAKVLTGFPSILAGVFVYAIIVLAMGTYSALAGGVSLAVLMLPTVVLTAEEAMKTVPRRMKDAGLYPHSDDLEDRVADRFAGHPDRCHIGRCPRRRRVGAAALYGALQQLLADQPARADRLVVDPHIQLFEHAVRRPDRAGVGSLASPRIDCARLQHPQPRPWAIEDLETGRLNRVCHPNQRQPSGTTGADAFRNRDRMRR